MSRNPLSKVPFEELLQRARAGEARALDELFHRSRKQLDKWAARYPNPAQPGGARPSEFTQQTSMVAFSHFSTFEGNTPGEWFAWLKKILGNHAEESTRRAQQQKRDTRATVSLDDEESLGAAIPQRSPSQAVSIHEEWRQLLVCVFELPDNQREAICLCYLEELPVAEVARRMRKTEPSIAGLLQRGWLKVVTQMQQEAGAEGVAGPQVRSDLTVALLDYLRRRERGEKVDPAAFASQHPTCADKLREKLQWIERLQALRPEPPRK